MSNVTPLLKGKPVWSLRPGCFPNSAEIKQLAADFPNHTIRTEHRYQPCVFVVTVSRK